MEQLVIDIQSSKDAHLIKELLKHFKQVEVKSFSTELNGKEAQFRIEQGLKDADRNNMKSWSTIKNELTNKIQTHKK